MFYTVRSIYSNNESNITNKASLSHYCHRVIRDMVLTVQWSKEHVNKYARQWSRPNYRIATQWRHSSTNGRTETLTAISLQAQYIPESRRPAYQRTVLFPSPGNSRTGLWPGTLGPFCSGRNRWVWCVRVQWWGGYLASSLYALCRNCRDREKLI